MDVVDFRALKNGCFVFSVTSSDDEFDLTYLESEYGSQEEISHVYKYHNFHNYFYLVNRGNAVNFLHGAVVGDFIHLVKGEMMEAYKILISERCDSGIHEVPNETRERIASVWLSVFASE
jgi:adenosylhomocysteinase